jgi:TRAP-type uncharacterized transport system substrate-binding protein
VTARTFLASRAVRRVAAIIGILALFALAISRLDLQPNLKRVNVTMLSGSKDGHYYALVSELASAARAGGGRIENVATQGSIENMQRLVAARQSCAAQFALVQDGLDWPAGLELVARLPQAESVFFLGRDVDRIHSLAELRGFRIGVGPEGSGTATLARAILESRFLSSLELKLLNLPLDQQLAKLQTGELDLGVLVMDEDAALVEDAVRMRGLEILSLPEADVIARRVPRVRTGRIAPGQYDPVSILPPTEKTVLKVDTLVVGNGCARRSTTTGLLTLLARHFPDFTQRNRETASASGLPLVAASRTFFENGGPDLATEHIPWAVDVMPLSNWIYTITAVSLWFNLMAVWSRFRLWRIDTNRVRAESRLETLFRPGITPGEIARMAPEDKQRTPGHQAQLADLIATYEALSARCRRQSLSFVSDMGQEIRYRYQEHLMAEYLDALRIFRERLSRT